METWQFISEKLSTAAKLMLLYVLESEGSSPGRQGFKMAVAEDGSIAGTIGGGIMELKLVEKAKQMLAGNERTPLVMRQNHDKEKDNRSGMICSGSQLIVFMQLSHDDIASVETITEGAPVTLELSPNGITVLESSSKEKKHSLHFMDEADWLYTEKLNERPIIHIIGGGHVSLALSELMCFLGFYSKVYDDRPELNTILDNFFANEKIIIPSYEQLGDFITDCENDYAVIMTLGYRTDKIALLQILNKAFYYLGMMGSASKIDNLFAELRVEGIDEEKLKKVFTPIGLNIYSKTAPEIAVSIAAEIIREKNKGLSTGRQKD